MPTIRNSSFVVGRLLAALGLVFLLWPGDVPWVSDEPILLSLALSQLRSGTVAVHGITGSHGAIYGPAPVWIYMALLALTRNLAALVLVRAVLFATAVAAAVIWVARSSTKVRPTLGAIVFLSVYFWIFSRVLWDNFGVCFSGLAVAAYGSFAVERKAWKSWFLAAVLALLVLTHLKTLAVVVPILVLLGLYHWKWYRDRPWLTAAQAAAATLLTAPYLRLLATRELASFDVGDRSPWAGWFFPLMGGRLFSAAGLDYFFGDGWTRAGGVPVQAAAAVTWVAVPMLWGGLWLAA
jgi:hypothetical protein